MPAIPVTVAVSLGLVITFVVMFWRERRRPHAGGAERDSLQPLADELRRAVPPSSRR